jgi:hypothetical protein
MSWLIYYDMTPESRNSGARARLPLKSNGKVCVTTDRTNESFPGNKLLNTHYRGKEHADYTRRTVRMYVLLAVRTGS